MLDRACKVVAYGLAADRHPSLAEPAQRAKALGLVTKVITSLCVKGSGTCRLNLKGNPYGRPIRVRRGTAMERQVRERPGEVIYGMGEETVAEVVARMLAERELTLGTIECGVDGIVSRQIFDAPDGPAVLGNSLIVDEVEEAINLLDLPRAQFRSAGDFSAKAARAAAREGRAFLGVNLCLAVWVPAPIADDSRERQPIHIALDTGQEVIVQTFQYGGHNERATDWLVNRALDMVRRALL